MSSACSGNRRAPSLACALAACLIAQAAPAQTAGDGGHNAIPIKGDADGATIERVEVTLARSGGDASRDGAALARLRRSLATLEGRAFSRLLIETRLAEPRARLGYGVIDYRLADAATPGHVVLQVELDTAAPRADADAKFPALYRSDRALATAMLSGGFGLYSDGMPWFGRPDLFLKGSPVAGRRPGAQPSWTEGYVEAGLGLAARLGDSPFSAYGAATAATSWSLGQDVFRSDPRSYTSVEKAYGGLLYVDPENGNSLNLSAGRQNVTLNDGFLIHFVRGSSNAAERGGTYLGPRNANDFSAVLDANFGPWTAKAFYIDPNELEWLESNSVFAGVNLRYALTPNLSLDASYIAIPRSGGSLAAPGGVRLPREGLQTKAAHGRWRQALGVKGLWLEGEIAHETHERFAMSAWAWYGLVGYQFAESPWTPSLSYRYAYASGDNPSTSRYERFDPLLSTGLGNWLQGVNFGKITSNSNLAVHRVQFNIAPTPTLNVTFDWHWLRAPQLNNLGGLPALSSLSAHDIGHEFTLTGRWAISKNFYLQTLGSVAIPGAALRDIGARNPWSSLQASLYWFL